MGGIRLAFTALRVRNFEASVRFYRDGLGVPLHPDPMETHQEYSWHAPYLHFAIFPLAPGDEPSRTELGFAVTDLDEAHARAISMGIEVAHPPRQEPWGRTASYLDPDGNTVMLSERARD